MLTASMPKVEMRPATVSEISGCPQVTEADRSMGQMRSTAYEPAFVFMRSRVEGSCPSLPFLVVGGLLVLLAR